MENRLSSTRRKSRTSTARPISLSEICQRTLTRSNLWSCSRFTVKLALANSKFLLTERAEALVTFSSSSKRVLKMQLQNSMIPMLEKTLFLWPYTPRKTREKLKVRNSQTYLLGTCQPTTLSSNCMISSKNSEISTQ